MNLVQMIKTISDFLTGLGAPVLLPIIVFLMGLVFGQKPRKAIVCGLTLGAGFIGLNLVIGLLINQLAPAVNAMVETVGVKRDILDVGWGVAAGIAFGTTAGALIVPVSLSVNVLMLVFRLTRTLNVDIWNFWNHAFTASVVFLASGNLALGLVAGAIHAALCLIIADLGAKRVQEFYELPGISIPHGWAVTSVPIIAAVNWVLDRIPYVKDITWDEGTIRDRWGIIGNPLVLGTTLGVIVGLFAGYWRDLSKLLNLGVSVGAVMILIPKVIGLFMEALTGVSESAKDFMKRRFGGREFYIGLDSAILIGHPVTVAAAVILVPIVLALSFVLPGNRVLAFGDLAALAYFVSMVPAFSKGNLFRSVVSGIVIMSVVLWVCSSFGSSLTQMALSIGYKMPEGAVDITAMSAGNWITWVLFQVGRLIGG
ncbi:MAG: PTS galactitol transporter subunit IIC [Ignavibacteriales bacterium]